MWIFCRCQRLFCLCNVGLDMGTACSVGQKRSSVGSSGEGLIRDEIRKPGGISSSIVYSNLWNPFRISRDEAENLLQGSYPGAFIFSHNITSEMFLSMSTGKYVCHHPVLKHSERYVIGGRDFDNIEEAVSFYRTSPLGEATLTEQFQSSHQAQIKPQTNNNVVNSPPRPQKANTKRVTFNVPLSKSSTVSGPVSITVDSTGSPTITIGTTVSTNIRLDSNESKSAEAVRDIDIEQEMIKKILSKPRKSICRVQPQDSLSTSSENMFKEEVF